MIFVFTYLGIGFGLGACCGLAQLSLGDDDVLSAVALPFALSILWLPALICLVVTEILAWHNRRVLDRWIREKGLLGGDTPTEK